MAKVFFVFGIHNHQPVGNFDFVFEDAFNKSYSPFLNILQQHPKIRITMHYSGILFDWLLNNHPEYINRLAKMVNSGQIEMMTGAFYEPILMTIPDRDKIGQILKLTETVKQHTKYNPTGFWLAERVWEPHLPKVLRAAGIEYTIVDDVHFKYAGLEEEKLTGYYITEEQGATLKIFPICEKLRYTIPFQSPEATLDHLREIAANGKNRVGIFADDGEKFGIWPDTYDHVFKNNWLEQFFTAIENAGDWVEMIHFGELIERLPPLGRIYLPTASYREMMEWALPFQANRELEDFEQQLENLNLSEKYGIYVRGGFWRNFLVKYPESNRMQKKMLYVSQKIEDQKDSLSEQKKQEALDHLWAGQCNCSYWHGVFGGLYLTHLRHAIYQNLIKAEIVLEENRVRKNPEFTILDLTGNGMDDIIVESSNLNIYIDPYLGGNIFEIDFKPAAVNLLDTMTRREEGYHRKLLGKMNSDTKNQKVSSIHDLVIAKENDLHEHLKYDWYSRNALIDHFLAPDTTLQSFADSQYREVGDFINTPYEYEIAREEKSVRIHLYRDGFVLINKEKLPFRVSKQIVISENSGTLGIEYKIRNLSSKNAKIRFGVEWNIGLLAGDSPDRYYEIPGKNLIEKHLASKGELAEITNFSLVDLWQNLRISFLFDQPASIWRFPIETVSLSEAGFERIYQNSTILSFWQFLINSEEEKVFSFKYEIKNS